MQTRKKFTKRTALLALAVAAVGFVVGVWQFSPRSAWLVGSVLLAAWAITAEWPDPRERRRP